MKEKNIEKIKSIMIFFLIMTVLFLSATILDMKNDRTYTSKDVKIADTKEYTQNKIVDTDTDTEKTNEISCSVNKKEETLYNQLVNQFGKEKTDTMFNILEKADEDTIHRICNRYKINRKEVVKLIKNSKTILTEKQIETIKNNLKYR